MQGNDTEPPLTPVLEGGERVEGHLKMGAGVYPGPHGEDIEIRNVWAYNLEAEMALMCETIERYPFVAMDTEFPGVVARPICPPNSPDYAYQSLRCNCDLLKIIQLGLSFMDEDGQFPPGCQCWQFNFKFSLSEDMYAQDSIDLLQNSGIDFQLLEADGIEVNKFAELLISSGLVLLPRVKWVSFHSGYDFGYLLRLLTDTPLPQEEGRFFDLLRLYFPALYDIKFLMHDVSMHGGLSKLADDLDCPRIGPMHQAGSDSLLTMLTFFRLVDTQFGGDIEERFSGELFGYGTNATAGYRPQLAVTFSKPQPQSGSAAGAPSGSGDAMGSFDGPSAAEDARDGDGDLGILDEAGDGTVANALSEGGSSSSSSSSNGSVVSGPVANSLMPLGLPNSIMGAPQGHPAGVGVNPLGLPSLNPNGAVHLANPLGTHVHPSMPPPSHSLHHSMEPQMQHVGHSNVFVGGNPGTLLGQHQQVPPMQMTGPPAAGLDLFGRRR